MDRVLKFDEIVAELLAEVREAHKSGQRVSDDLMLALYTVFGERLLHAFALVDTRKVTLLKSPSGRSMFEVIGRDGRMYSLFGPENFCLCESFEKEVLQERTAFTCVHVLAVWLATCMGVHGERSISNALMGIVVTNAVKIDGIVTEPYGEDV